jgi:hypothetical protein
VRGPWVDAALVLAALIALGLQTEVVTRTGFLMGDFRAFYCAARVTSHGANPYLAQPLRTCEVSVGSERFFRMNPGVTIPAPLPGYAIAGFVPLSILPFIPAAILWAVLLSSAWIAAVAALAKLAGEPWQIGFAALAVALGALSLPFGEVVPIAVACICGAAYFAREQRWGAATLCAAGAMIEPHLGLPACLGLAVGAPATRVPLGLALATLGAVSVGLLGPAANMEYLGSVLPAHALSEATRDTQYSLTAVLTAVGVAPALSVKAGALWYAAMLVFGTFVAGRLAKQTSNAAFLACVPPAFAVLGGSFIHLTQIAVALPAAILLASTARKSAAVLAVVALLLLSVPWGWVVSPALTLTPLVPVAYLAWRYWNPNLGAVLAAGLLAGMLLLGLGRLYTLKGVHLTAAVAVPAIDPRLAESSWSAYSRDNSSAGIAAWAVRIPTWGGLLILLAGLTATAGVALAPRRYAWNYLPRENA